MRLSTLTVAALLSFSGIALANDPPTTVIMTSGGAAQQFTGTLQQGGSKSFTYNVSTDRIVTLIIRARNEDCTAEMGSDADHGFVSDFGRFPATRVEHAKAGEVFKISFHQTRAAWISKIPCAYSFSIQ